MLIAHPDSRGNTRPRCFALCPPPHPHTPPPPHPPHLGWLTGLQVSQMRLDAADLHIYGPWERD